MEKQMEDNLEFELELETMAAIDALDQGHGAQEDDIKTLVWIRREIRFNQTLEQLLLDHKISAIWPDGQPEPKFTKVEN